MKRPLAGLLALLVITGFLIWWFHPRQVVKRRVNSLMDTVSLAEGAGTAARNLKAYPLNRLLATQVELSGTGDRRADGAFSRSEIEAGFTWLAQNAQSTRFATRRFESITLTGDRAVVRAIVDARVVLGGEMLLDGAHDVRLDWRREDDGWRLTSASWEPR